MTRRKPYTRTAKFQPFKSRLPFGFAVLYLMIHVPFLVFWKIGITNTNVGASKRARSIDAEMFGFPFPVFFVPVPFAYHIEQWLHGMLKPLNVSFYNGSGRTEWFWFPAAVFAFGVMAGIYFGYWCAGCWIFETYLNNQT
jgi:hypothetical protein